MKKSKLKIMLILSVFLALAMILCIFIFKNPKDKQEYNIDKKEAKILEIENKKIYDISSSISKKGVTTKIKNISTDPVRDITIDYVELDKDNKKLSNKQIPVDITLKKNEKALVSIIPAEYTETIDITGYRYKKEDYDIKVDLDNDEVAAIKEDKKENEKIDSGEKYEILNIDNLIQMDKTNYKLEIKNKSDKNIGNIILKTAEKNQYGEYVSVTDISANTTLEAKGNIKMILSSSNENNKLEIVGYTYDDIGSKINIDVDLKANSADVVKN